MTLSFQDIDHCKTYKNVCKECAEGYQLAKTNTDPECLDSYFYSEYSKAQNKIQNCVQLNADGSACEVCERDYVPSNDACVYSPGCESLTQNGEGCANCLYPFTQMDNNKCEKKPPCKIWREGSCSTCGDYYSYLMELVLKYLLSIV